MIIFYIAWHFTSEIFFFFFFFFSKKTYTKITLRDLDQRVRARSEIRAILEPVWQDSEMLYVEKRVDLRQ